MPLTPKQCASRLGTSKSLIYSLLRQGRLEAVRIGCRGKGKWLVEESVLDAFVEACKVEVKSSPTPLKHIR